MSFDLRLLAVSGETAGSDMSESMAVSLSDPLGCYGATGPASTVAHIVPPSGGPSLTAARSPVTEEIVGRGADSASGVRHLFAGSDESPKRDSFGCLG
jgi:hypothetical protein